MTLSSRNQSAQQIVMGYVVGSRPLSQQIFKRGKFQFKRLDVDDRKMFKRMNYG
jgi:hypothetical protein